MAYHKVTSIGNVGQTFYRDDRTFDGSSSHPTAPLLIFSDTRAGAGGPVTSGGGPVGDGLPVQLLFWGSWWAGPGSAHAAEIENQVKQMFSSPYFSQLSQYGVSPPTWRGTLFVTKPDPPAQDGDSMAGFKLFTDLIDDGTLPDPEDELFAPVILMPQGFGTQTNPAGQTWAGLHRGELSYFWPLPDFDWYWYAEITFSDNADDTSRIVSHELVELLTDPQQSGWSRAAPAGSDEIADSADVSASGQSAFVNDARVSAYWSNAHNATVIPIDRDYSASLAGEIEVEHTHSIAAGTFRPTDRDRALCKAFEACCIEDRDYGWWVTGRDEAATLRVDTHRYREPQVSWTVGGVPIPASAVVKVPVSAAARYDGRDLRWVGETEVELQVELANATLTLHTSHTDLNFDVDVACGVHDGSITGNLKTDVVATPLITVGFVGAELTIDPDYERQRKACGQWLASRFGGTRHSPYQQPKPGDPVEIDPGIVERLPAWTRVGAFTSARRAVALANLGRLALEPELADALTAVLLRDTPLLAASLGPRETAAPLGVE